MAFKKKFNKKDALFIQEEYRLTDKQIAFWKDFNYLPEVLLNPEEVEAIYENKRSLVVKTLYLSWVNKLGLEKSGVVRRRDFKEYKNNPKSMKKWAVATIFSYLADIEIEALSEKEPLRFLEKNHNLFKYKTLGDCIEIEGKEIGVLIANKSYQFKRDISRNFKIYSLLKGSLLEFNNKF